MLYRHLRFLMGLLQPTEMTIHLFHLSIVGAAHSHRSLLLDWNDGIKVGRDLTGFTVRVYLSTLWTEYIDLIVRLSPLEGWAVRGLAPRFGELFMVFVALGLAVLGRIGLAVVSAGLYCSWYFCAALIRRASLLAKKMTSSSTTELELTFTSDVPFCSDGLSIKISPFGKCETASVKLLWI